MSKSTYLFQSKGEYLKHSFYVFMKNHMAITKYFFFSRVEIVGAEKIPVGNPVIYSCTHQNAFMDALLIGTISPMKITSITRSDVFGDHAGMWFMTALQMQPIYRMQDGYEKLAKNEQVFENVRQRLRGNEGVLIFSEGNHGDEYFLRPLQKGSSRMALESQEVMMEKDIHVVPIGINYFHHQRPFHKLTVVFGDPIKVKDYFDLYKEHSAKAANQLKNKITEGMKECMILPQYDDDYEKRKSFINRRNFGLKFHEIKKRINELDGLKPAKKTIPFLRSLGKILGIFNFLPLLLLQIGLSKFKDIVFYGSIKWFFALFIFPAWWIVIFVGTSVFLGWKVGLICSMGSFIMLFLRQWLIQRSNVEHANIYLEKMKKAA